MTGSKVPKEFRILTLYRYRGSAGRAFDERLYCPALRTDLLRALRRGIQQRSGRMVPRRVVEVAISDVAGATRAALSISISAPRSG
jgi:hypothetical protein